MAFRASSSRPFLTYQTGDSGRKGRPMANRVGTRKVMTKASRKLHSPLILEEPQPVMEERKKPSTMMTLVRELRELRRAAGAFSVTYRGGVTVERPTERPRRSLDTKRIGRLGAKTSAKEEEIDRATAVQRTALRPTQSANWPAKKAPKICPIVLAAFQSDCQSAVMTY